MVATAARVSICFALLACASVFAAEPVHKRLRPGTSYLISQEVERGIEKETHDPRFDLIFENVRGDIAVYAGDGPAKDVRTKPGTKRIISANYFIPANGCVVDFIAGETLLKDQQCNEPLPQRWTYLNRKEEVKCQLLQPGRESIVVSAGTFEVFKVECQREFDSPKRFQTTTYWYEPSIGTMVRTQRKTTDEQGALVFGMSEQLLEIAPIPRD